MTRQSELKHATRPAAMPAKRSSIVALRGDERLEREVELVDKIEPYEVPFLGILPMRGESSEKSPA